MQTSTHGVSIGETEVRKEFLADHEAQAEREWACPAGDRDGADARRAARATTVDD